jgi:hypothetical protein
MSSGLNSPDIRNYTVGKGIVSFQKNGSGSFRDIGNCPGFEFTPSVEKLDHFSSRTGVKKKDRSVTVSTEGELKITMEEFSPENMALALMGDVDVDSTGRAQIEILSLGEITGKVKFVGTNDIGQQYTWLFTNVSFTPSSTLSPLSDEWGTIEITGETLADNTGSFGTVTHTGGEGFEIDSSS